MKRFALLTAAVLCALALFAGCSNSSQAKTGCDYDTFVTAMTDQGYVITDLTANLNQAGLTGAWKAEKPDGQTLTLRYYNWDSAERAASTFSSFQAGYDNENPTSKQSQEGDNYQTYRAEFSDMQNVVILSRVDNTILYIIGDLSDAKSADDMAQSLHY
jgi:hypothetical protein